MTSGPEPNIHCASCTMFMHLVVQHAFHKSACRTECRHPDGRKDPTEACVQECQRNTPGTHHWHSTLKQGTSPHSGILSLMTGSSQLQPTLTTCLTSTLTNGQRCLEPAPAMVNRTTKLKSHCSSQSNQSHVRLRTTTLMRKKCFDNKCQHQIH